MATYSTELSLRSRIADLRWQRDITQAELALSAGVTRQAIIHIERNQSAPSILLACKMAAALGVPVTELFIVEKVQHRCLSALPAGCSPVSSVY